MKTALAIATLTGIASAAQADHTTFMNADLQAFDTTDSTWKDYISVAPGSTVNMRVQISWDLATGLALAWQGMTIRQIDVIGSSALDTAVNFAGLLTPANQAFKLYNPGGAATIDRDPSPSMSIQLNQTTINLGGSTANPIVTFSFDYKVDAINLSDRTITMAVLNNADMTLAGIYITPGGTVMSVPAAGRSFDGASIHVVPSPGALALLAMIGLGVRRQRV